ncbi:MAG: exodeoxyribonuclease III, partial [Nocardioides sp.]|nr:exodeoxyribonuclease III [Nocardioides sp.]
MRIATWNVNSARARIDRILGFLERHDIDVLAMQETKCKDAQFPTERFTDLGYEVAHFGLSQWNGVAVVSRVGLEDVATSFPEQPGFHKDPEQDQAVEARALGATCDGVRIWSLYVPNGRELEDPHYT